MRKMLLVFLLVLGLSFTLSACGGGGESESDGAAADNSVGNAANGEKLFAQTTIGTANSPGCITCHSLEPGVVLVGPAQHDVGRARGNARRRH
jgi:cytochrome c2